MLLLNQVTSRSDLDYFPGQWVNDTDPVSTLIATSYISMFIFVFKASTTSVLGFVYVSVSLPFSFIPY